MNNTSIGSWITTNNVSVAELMSSFSFDWLCVDLEHTSTDYKDLLKLILTIQANNKKAYVRVGSNDPLIIKRALDIGVDGVIVPMINTADDAKKAINSIFYPPVGTRGVGLYRAQGYGFDFENYRDNKSKKIEFIAQIEHVDAINNLDSILSLENVHGTIIGPYDLSSSIGKTGQLDCKELNDLVAKYENTSKKYVKKMGYHVVPVDFRKVEEKIALGYNFIAFGFDLNFLGFSIKTQLENLKK